MKCCLILLLLLTAAAFIRADALPDFTDYYKVKVITEKGTETIGYIEVYPSYLTTAQQPSGYSQQAVKQGQELLSLVRENHANKPSNEVLTVFTTYVSWKNDHFFVKEGIRKYPFEQIKSILALQEIRHYSLFDDTANKSIRMYHGEYLSEAEAKLVRKGVLHSLSGDYAKSYQSLLLLSTNPSYTQLDLYLYACLMNKQTDEGETDYLEGIHPFLSAEEIEDEKAVIWGYIHDLDFSQAGRITSNLKKSGEAWKKMAEYLQNSQSILPEAKTGAITSLQNAAAACSQKAAEISLLTTSELREKSDPDKQTLYNSIIQSLVPQFSFPSKFSYEEWKPYLLKRGIISVLDNIMP